MGLRNFIYKFTGIDLKKKKYFFHPYCFEEILKKKNCFETLNNIDILFLGSSYCAYSIVPSKFDCNVFNFGTTSQDLYNSLNIYKHYQEKQIKKVALIYSAFADGFNLQKTSSKEICTYFNYLIDTDYQEYNKDGAKLLKKCNKLEKELNCIYTKNENGFLYPFSFMIDEVTNEVAEKHYRENIRVDTQTKYLFDLIKLCEKNNTEFVIIIPPYRSDYKESLLKHSSFSDIFRTAIKLQNNENISLIDLFNNDQFTDDDFGDSHHLTNKGALKASNILNDLLCK